MPKSDEILERSCETCKYLLTLCRKDTLEYSYLCKVLTPFWAMGNPTLAVPLQQRGRECTTWEQRKNE